MPSIWSIVFTVSFSVIKVAVGNPVGSECCQSKTVGEHSYTLTQSSGPWPDKCKKACAYTRNGEVGSLYCFGPGDLAATCIEDHTDSAYLYLSDTKILSLPTFKEIACDQGFPDKSLSSASAAEVMYQGQKELMVCGGYNIKGCYVWTQKGWVKTDEEFPRFWAASSILEDGQWLVSGGWNGTAGLKPTMIYSEAEGWKEHASLPDVAGHHCQVSIGSDTYIIGGTGGTGKNYKLSKGDAQWTVLRNMNTPRYAHACAVFDGSIYVIGGLDAEDKSTQSSVEIYNPADDTWSNASELPTTLAYTHAVTYEDTLFVFGGSHSTNNTQSGDDSTDNTDVYKLTKGSNTWKMAEDVKMSTTIREIFPAVTVSNLHCNQ